MRSRCRSRSRARRSRSAQHRDRGRRAGRRARRRASARRRRRDVHGQGGRQAPRRRLRTDDARGDRRPAALSRRAHAEHRAGRARCVLPADREARRPAGSSAPRRSSAGGIPTRGLVRPDEFIPLAEENGLILSLGRWVIAEACEQIAAWDRGPGLDPDSFVSVNLSSVQLQQAEFIGEIESILKSTGLAAERLVVELTETAMFQDTDDHDRAARDRPRPRRPDRPRRLRDRLLLARLPPPIPRRHPQDRPGIRRFRRTATKANGRSPTPIVALGRTLGLQIIAEGIEEDSPAPTCCGASAASWARASTSPARSRRAPSRPPWPWNSRSGSASGSRSRRRDRPN